MSEFQAPGKPFRFSKSTSKTTGRVNTPASSPRFSCSSSPDSPSILRLSVKNSPQFPVVPTTISMTPISPGSRREGDDLLKSTALSESKMLVVSSPLPSSPLFLISIAKRIVSPGSKRPFLIDPDSSIILWPNNSNCGAGTLAVNSTPNP